MGKDTTNVEMLFTEQEPGSTESANQQYKEYVAKVGPAKAEKFTVWLEKAKKSGLLDTAKTLFEKFVPSKKPAPAPSSGGSPAPKKYLGMTPFWATVTVAAGVGLIAFGIYKLATRNKGKSA